MTKKQPGAPPQFTLDETKSIPEALQDMANMVEALTNAETIQRVQVNELINLTCGLILRLQRQTLAAQEQTIDYCTAYKKQMETLAKHNYELATYLYKQGITSMHEPANA